MENLTVQTFKERSMAYSFKVKHIKGSKNMFFGDPLSRYPVNNPDETDRCLTKELAALNITSIHRNIDSIAVTVNDIKRKGIKDDLYKSLYEILNCPITATVNIKVNSSLKEFHSVSDRLCIVDGMIMYGFEGNPLRILVPKNLRKTIIENLHSANQGSTSMLARARQSVNWPGMDQDIQEHCISCMDCRLELLLYQRSPCNPLKFLYILFKKLPVIYLK